MYSSCKEDIDTRIVFHSLHFYPNALLCPGQNTLLLLHVQPTA